MNEGDWLSTNPDISIREGPVCIFDLFKTSNATVDEVLCDSETGKC